MQIQMDKNKKKNQRTKYKERTKKLKKLSRPGIGEKKSRFLRTAGW